MQDLQEKNHELSRGIPFSLAGLGKTPGVSAAKRTLFSSLLLIFLLILLGLPSPVSAGEARIAFLEFQVNGRDLDKDLGIAAS